jgi:hypothetical protein
MPPSSAVPGGARLFQRLYTRLGCLGRPPQFIVEYYPYAGLAHSIRLRDEIALVRLSDALRNAPAKVLEAAAAILLSRMYRRRAPRESLVEYRRFTLAPRTRRRVATIRRARGRRVSSSPRGAVHHLERMFVRLNRCYFAGRLRRPCLSWSDRSWRTQFGCFDPALDQIVLNRRLDRDAVPAYVVEFVLFHEMLHVKHPMRATRCTMRSHSREFRLEEKRYAHYAEARKFLARLS